MIIALKAEELHKAGLPTSFYRNPLGALCHLPSRGGRGQRADATCHLPPALSRGQRAEGVEDYESMFGNMMNCLNFLTV